MLLCYYTSKLSENTTLNRGFTIKNPAQDNQVLLKHVKKLLKKDPYLKLN
jgi:hypothetical protein